MSHCFGTLDDTERRWKGASDENGSPLDTERRDRLVELADGPTGLAYGTGLRNGPMELAAMGTGGTC